MPELRLQASRDCRALSPGRRRRCRVSLSLTFSLFVVSVNVNVAALHGNSLTLSLACTLSLFAALLLVACSAAKSRAAIEGISLPVCRFCRSASLFLCLSAPSRITSLPSLTYYLCPASRLTLWHDNVTHLS